ncbi:MAG: NAD-dependent epimerase/dehydratase family protein, partial [Clostridia bacterium]|nr:NAD-dependent epimerase/dehydratase family protein [Clostridia bacterium]
MERKRWTEEALDELLTTPSDALAEDMAKLNGDILVLGAGGKMGPTLCVLAKRAMEKAGIHRNVIAVSRGSDRRAKRYMEENGVKTISCDLLDTEALRALPDTENVIYMAGKKFGTDGNEWQTWAMNAALPAYTAEKYKDSRIVVFSSGNIYPLVPVTGGGCSEEDRTGPVGEYAMSCLARERVFEYAANTWGTKVFFFRLNYAVDLRYGVLYDIARTILEEKPVSMRTACFNCIWQGSANEIAIRGLLHASSPACTMNVTGP